MNVRTAVSRLLAGIALGLAFASSSPAIADPPAKSLYERLGGVGPISVVVDEFIERLFVDDLLNANPAISEARARVPRSYLKFHVTTLLCQVTGGPCKYTGRSMKDSHARLGITEREWTEMAAVFQAVLDKYKVPAREQQELFALVGGTKADIVVAESKAK